MATMTLYFGTITGIFRLPLTEAADLDGYREVAVTYVISNLNADTAGDLTLEIFDAPRNNASHYSEERVTESGSISADGVKDSYITQFSRYLTLKATWQNAPTVNTTADIEVLLVPKA